MVEPAEVWTFENTLVADIIVVSVSLSLAVSLFYVAVFCFLDKTVTAIFATVPIVLMFVGLWAIHFYPSLLLLVFAALLVFFVAVMLYICSGGD